MQANYFDPFSVWKSLYSEMEPKMSQSMQKWLESEEYAAFSGKLLSATLQMEQHWLKTMEQMMQTYNIPTMKDFARLGELLVGVEDKVDSIDERLIRLEKLAINTADVREQLGTVAAQLETIGKMLHPEEADAEKQDTTTKNRKRPQRVDDGADDAKPGLV